jgi:hypothetical protein
MQTRWVAVATLVLGGCLVDEDLYEARRAALTDRDGDGVTPDDGDCDDTDAARAPGLGERCGDGVDNDCDGRVDGADDDVDGRIYADTDGDGWGDPETAAAACAAPDGWSITADDCDDRDPTTYPGADELCDGRDNDCDGSSESEDDLSFSTYFIDQDGDGWGDTDRPVRACAPPSDAVEQDGDCDDGDSAVSPAAPETLDGTDEDCSGEIDDLVAERDGVVLILDRAGEAAGAALAWMPAAEPATLIVGAPGSDAGAGAACSVSVWRRTGSGFEAAAGPLLSAGGSRACGASLGAVDASRVLVGSPGDSRVELWDIDTPSLERVWTHNVSSRDKAGTQVASADLDGDGVVEFLVTGATFSAPVRFSGRLWVVPFDAPDGYLNEVSATSFDGSENAELGAALAVGADVDGDGYGDFSVGAGGGGLGAAWLFHGGVALPTSLDDAGARLDVADGSTASAVAIGAGEWAWAVCAADANGGGGVAYLLAEAPSGVVDLSDSQSIRGGGASPVGSACVLAAGGVVVGDPRGPGELGWFDEVEGSPSLAAAQASIVGSGADDFASAMAWSESTSLLAVGASAWGSDNRGRVYVFAGPRDGG